jgi:hypothetical protein
MAATCCASRRAHGLSLGVGVAERPVTIDSQLKLGNFSLSFTDLKIPFAGFPLTVTRTYDTLYASTAGEFGYGWRRQSGQ